DSAKASRGEWISGVIKINRVGAAGAQRLGKVHEDRAIVALVFERRRAEEDLVYVQRRMQIELDPRIVLEHLETDDRLSAEVFLIGIHSDIEMVKEQVVVRAIRPVLA